MSFDDGAQGEFTLPPSELDAGLESAPRQLWGPPSTSTTPSTLETMLLSEPGTTTTSLRFKYDALLVARDLASGEADVEDEQLGGVACDHRSRVTLAVRRAFLVSSCHASVCRATSCARIRAAASPTRTHRSGCRGHRHGFELLPPQHARTDLAVAATGTGRAVLPVGVAAARMKLLEAVQTYGVAIIEGAPAEPDAGNAIADAMVGAVQTTAFGYKFVIKQVANAHNLAFDSIALQQHTDFTYLDPVPDVAIFACIQVIHPRPFFRRCRRHHCPGLLADHHVAPSRVVPCVCVSCVRPF